MSIETLSDERDESEILESRNTLKRELQVEIIETKKKGKRTLAAAKFWLSRALFGAIIGSGVLMSDSAVGAGEKDADKSEIILVEHTALRTKLEKQFGLDYLDNILLFGEFNSANYIQRSKQFSYPIPADGFIDIKKIEVDNKTVEAMVCALPSGFYQNINGVSFVNKKEKPDEEYGLSEGWDAAAESNGKRRSITFFEDGLRDRSTFTESFLHEFGHLVDWKNNRFLTQKEKLYLLGMIGERLISSDRYYSEYVENIHNEDKQYEFSLEAEEYFAEIVLAYFAFPAELLPEDSEIVEFVIRKTDPNFDSYTAHKAYQDYILDGKNNFVAQN